MNAHLPTTFQSTYSRSPAASAVDALSATSSAAKSGIESDAQAFSRWMAQHREAQGGTRSAAITPSQPQPAQKPPMATVSRPAINARPAPEGKAAEPTRQDEAEPSSPQKLSARASAKPTSKPASVKTPEAGRLQDASTEPVDAKPSDGATEALLGEEINFRTTQGEATAWVKELQPPADLAAGDPAAMLAWLATLAQSGSGPGLVSEAGLEPSMGEGSEVSLAGAFSGSESLSRNDLSDRGWLAASGTAGWSSQGGQPSSGGQSGDTDQERAGALTLENLLGSPSETTLDPSAAAAFGHVMSRELQRAGDLDVAATAVAHHTGSLSTPLDSPQFPKALTDQLKLWLSGEATQGPMTAELRLNPAEMGPIHIKIALEGQTAQVDFAAAALETRQAIEASLPMLSSALEEAGLSLSGGGVSDQSQQPAWAEARREAEASRHLSGLVGGRSGHSTPGDDAMGTRPAVIRSSRPGGLDLYA